MSDNNNMPLDASEANTIRAAVSDAIEKMPGMEKYYAKNKKYCEINTLSDVEKGIGLFDLQGAKYIARYIDGSFMAQYPFSILLKSKCTSDKQNLIMTDFMDRLGVFLEEQVIDLSGGRNIIDITQTISTFENSRSENNIVTLQANFLLKYRKDD